MKSFCTTRFYLARATSAAELGRWKRLPAEAAAELAALLPAIMEKAFKGEL